MNIFHKLNNQKPIYHFFHYIGARLLIQGSCNKVFQHLYKQNPLNFQVPLLNQNRLILHYFKSPKIY